MLDYHYFELFCDDIQLGFYSIISTAEMMSKETMRYLKVEYFFCFKH